MKVVARNHIWWWPGIDTDTDSIAKSCEICLSLKNKPSISPLQPWSWPANPWQRVHVYLAGPIFGRMYLLAIDVHSKWLEVWEMSQTSILGHITSIFGLSQQLVTDNGPQFIAEEFRQFCKENGVKHIR